MDDETSHVEPEPLPDEVGNFNKRTDFNIE